MIASSSDTVDPYHSMIHWPLFGLCNTKSTFNSVVWGEASFLLGSQLIILTIRYEKNR